MAEQRIQCVMMLEGEEPISEASDEFDLLHADLPVLEPTFHPIMSPLYVATLEDEFTQWQLNRFNRSGSVNIRSIFKSSFFCAIHHCISLAILSILYWAIFFLAFRLSFSIIFVPVDALSDLIATSVAFSILTNERLCARLHLLFSRQGLAAYLLQLIRSFLLHHTLESIRSRRSTATGKFFILMLFRYMTYFQSCFVFEGLSLAFSSSCSFSLQLSFFTIPYVQSLGLFVSGMILIAIGPLTLGLGSWVAYFMRAFVFLAVCGSGTNVASIPGI
jgi:hypothetical protein